MSHEIDMSNNRANIAFAGELPWHGLGFKIDANSTLEQWQTAAGLNWEVLSEPIYVGSPTASNKFNLIDNRRALIRSDTRDCLSVTSDKYKPLQPLDVLNFFSDLIKKFGAFQMETAGSLRDGKKIWGLAKAVDGHNGFSTGGDAVDRYLLLATSYDYSLPTIVIQTAIRVVCANTLGFAFNAAQGGREKSIRVRHNTFFNPATIHSRLALDEQWDTFKKVAEVLMQKKMDRDATANYMGHVFYPKAKREAKEFSEKGMKKRVDELMGIYDMAPGQDLETAKGTAWGALNAVTNFVDHVAKSKNKGIRLDKAWFGEGATIKGRAFEEAIAYASPSLA